MPPKIHILFVFIPYYSKFFLILIGKPPPYQKQNCQHINLKSWSLGLRLLWVFKNKESLENLRHPKKFVFYLLKLKNTTKPY